MMISESEIKTPFYLIDEILIERNLKILKNVIERTGCKILLAQKAFSMYALYPKIGCYLSGTTASGLFEAKLGHDEMGGETHVFSTAYRDDEFDEISDNCDHIIFNSLSQWNKYKDKALSKGLECGLRFNPEHSTQQGHEIYDPCAYGSRLGITQDSLGSETPEGISGFHFHTLCEQNSDALAETLDVFESKFGHLINEQIKWINFGGGHHITRNDYNIELLIELISEFQEKYKVTVYLEPGEAVALNTGFLVSSVLDITRNGINNAILDASAACHMPDVLEMPYRPEIIGAGKADEFEFTYRLGGSTCLAGDIIGDYSFKKPLDIGSKLVFKDMAHYSMVKNNMFNGINLPSIVLKTSDNNYKMIREFVYEDFKQRLS